jgi:SAM-dependent methyltransferase
VESKQGAARAAIQTLLILLFEAAILALHFTTTRGSVWHEPVLLLLVFPVLLATAGGVRTAAPALVLPVVALTDDVANGEPAEIVFEVLFLLALSAAGLLTARSVDVERARNDRVLAETRERTTRLKSTSGLWQNVALTRMGAYATSVEGAFLDEALGARPGTGTVVDVGSAAGRLEHVLLRHADHVIATDLDRDEVYAMAEDPKLTTALVGALPTLPIRDDAVDAVIAIEVPAASDQAWFREECRRVVRPGGTVLVTLYNARSYKGLFTRIRRRLRRSGTRHWDNLYYQRSTAEQIQLWRAAGFQPHHMRGYYWPPLRRRSNSRWVSFGSAIERLLRLWSLAGISPCVLVELRRVKPTSQT